VTTPLLLESQEQDLRCPIPQAEEFYTALKKLRRADVQLVRFPGESHGVTTPPDESGGFSDQQDHGPA